jgi:hypothetical protein
VPIAELIARVSKLDPASAAFEEAKSIFNTQLSRDPEKLRLVQQINSYEDVELLIVAAKAKYDASHQDKKCSKWLAKLSSRVRFYGNIMDVLAQQHPEYVSLVWGAMKLMFVVSFPPTFPPVRSMSELRLFSWLRTTASSSQHLPKR